MESSSRFTVLTEEFQDDLALLAAESFNFDPDQSRGWFKNTGLENWRVVLDGQTVLAGLMQIPMSQWFGGRPVSMTGIAGVVVSPKCRGKGVGQTLIGSSLRELRKRGVGLSALYASTTSFYRRNGYEIGGPAYHFSLNLKEITGRAGGLEVRDFRGEDFSLAQELQEKSVRHHGALRRGAYLWHRVRHPRGDETQAVGFFGADGLEGYMLYRRHQNSNGDSILQISDLVLTSSAAKETFLGYLAGHRAIFQRAEWQAAESMPFLLDLAEKWSFSLTLMEYWMLRIVDIKAALEERGYPEGVRVTLGFELKDNILPENQGVWTLDVGEGVGVLQAGGTAEITLDVGALASLYSGFMSAEQLEIAGRLRGTSEGMRKASLAFQGKPVLCDFF